MSNLLALSTLLVPLLPLNEIDQLPVPEAQQIIFVRHGESQFNLPDENGLYYTSGKSQPVPLTSKGLEQAKRVGSKLVNKFQSLNELVICSSTAKRAYDTAVAMFQELRRHHNCQLGPAIDELQELGQGRWEGLPKDEVYEREIKKWELLPAIKKLTTPKLDTGESFQDCIDRALPALQSLIDQHPGKRIVIVCHFMMMNALCLHWSGIIPQLSNAPGSKLPMAVFGNCDMLVVEFPNHHVQEAQLVAHIQSGI